MNVEAVLRKNAYLRGIHAGRRCFVVATGPSIQEQDLSPLGDEIVIAVSHFHRHPASTAINPDYWVVADPKFWEEPEEYLVPLLGPMLEKGLSTRLFMPMAALPVVSTLAAGPLIDFHFFLYGGEDAAARPFDFTRPVPTWGQNVIGPAMMLGQYLGCDPIYLLGCDHDFLAMTKEQFEEQQCFGHFYDEGKIPPSSVLSWDRWQGAMATTLDQYRKLDQHALRHGRRIFNATAGGRLETFARVRYEDLFPYQSGTDDPERLAHAAVGHLNDGETMAARVLLERAQRASLRPDAVPVAGLDALLGLCAARDGQPEEALAYARLAVARQRDPAGLGAKLIASLS